MLNPDLPNERHGQNSRGPMPRGNHMHNSALLQPGSDNYDNFVTGNDADSVTPAFNLSALQHGFRRHWVVALVFAVVCSGATSLAAWYYFEPQYVAFAQLRVAGNEPRLVFETVDNTAQSSFEIYKRTQRELIRSRFVLNPVMRAPGVAELEIVRSELDPVAWLESKLQVDFPSEAEIMRISLGGQNASEITVLVNAIADTYIQEVVDAERLRRQERQHELEKLYNVAEEKVFTSREKLRSVAEKVGTGDSSTLTIKQQIALQHYAELRKEHTAVNFQLMRAKIELSAYEVGAKSVEKDEVAEATLELYVSADPTVQQHKSQVSDLEQRYESSKALLADGSEDLLKEYAQGLETAKLKLEQARAAARERLRETLVQKSRSDKTAFLEGIKSQIGILTEQEKTLKEEVEKNSKIADQIGKFSLEAEVLRAEIKHVEHIADTLGSEIESLKVELQSPSRVQLMQYAALPQSKDLKRQITSTTFSALLGFVLPVFCIAWVDCRQLRVNSGRELTQSLGLKVIGTLPFLPSGQRRRLSSERELKPYWRRTFQEALDTVRTMLLRSPDLQSSRVVMVTSAVSGEGKTTLASKLAESFARAGRKTLLIDFDLRRPSLDELYTPSIDIGMSELLRGEHAVPDVLWKTDVANLWLIAAGQTDDAALTGLAQNHSSIEEFFALLRGQFDFVIVDCCPILPVVDTMLIAQYVDAAVLSILRDVSHIPKIVAAHQRLSSLGVRILGAVVAETRKDAYYSDKYRLELKS